jgi:hypothetical protein
MHRDPEWISHAPCVGCESRARALARRSLRPWSVTLANYFLRRCADFGPTRPPLQQEAAQRFLPGARAPRSPTHRSTAGQYSANSFGFADMAPLVIWGILQRSENNAQTPPCILLCVAGCPVTRRLQESSSWAGDRQEAKYDF